MAVGLVPFALAMMASTCADALTVIGSAAGSYTDSMNSQSVVLNRLTASFPLPVAWLHVPRSGSSFMFNLLSLVPELCNDNGFCSGPWDQPTTGQVKKSCPGILIPESTSNCDSKSHFDLCQEFTIGTASLSRGAKLMGMFRQPEQRILSDWFFATKPELISTERKKNRLGNGTIADYARIHQGCAMRMLIGEAGDYRHCSESAPNFKPEDRMHEAINVLEKFSFVGLTEDWALSICLFNKMFGSPCRPMQLWDFSPHQNQNKTASRYDTSILKGWVDDYDGPVYQRATEIYADNLKRYQVSKGSCASCYREMEGRKKDGASDAVGNPMN